MDVIRPTPAPDTQTPVSYFKADDGKVYRRSADWQERLSTLSTASGKTLRASELKLWIPLGLAIIGLFFYIGSFFWQGLFLDTDPIGDAVLLFFLLGFLAALEYLMVVLVSSRIRGTYLANYRKTLLALHYTDLPVLIADEQYVLLLLEETREYPLLKWTGSGTPVSFEDRMWLAADYCRALNSFCATTGFVVKDLRHSSCLHFSGTRQAGVLSWIATASCIMFGMNPCCSAIPAWGLMTLINRNLERSGNLKAICDFFKGDYEGEVQKYEEEVRRFERERELLSNKASHYDVYKASTAEMLKHEARKGQRDDLPE